MPFINGRHYANPLYGQAVERTREGESGDEFNDEVVGSGAYDGPELADSVVTFGTNDEAGQPDFQLDGIERHARAKQHPAHRQGHQTAKSAHQVANSIYNETSSLRSVTERGPGSADELHDARTHIERIAHFGKATVASDVLSPPEAARAIKSYPPARAAYEDSQRAAREAFVGPDPTGGATHFYLDYGQKPPSWAAGKTPVAVFGPFKNVAGGGDVRKGAMVKIVIIR
ncbi:MAG TPA: hypothetical protein VGS27_23055 [Candidatus Sulfotelmatobacter sp.]|nr:hypothetical protein [Candidatus Sulfotelmatobacter sp.]